VVVATTWAGWLGYGAALLFVAGFFAFFAVAFVLVVAGIAHEAWCDNRYRHHRGVEDKHWRRRSALLQRGGSDRDERVQRHHAKALRHREKARRWDAYRDAARAAKTARDDITRPIHIDWDQPTPEEAHAEWVARNPEYAEAVEEGPRPPGSTPR
jgi:hypothetical protein